MSDMLSQSKCPINGSGTHTCVTVINCPCQKTRLVPFFEARRRHRASDRVKKRQEARCIAQRTIRPTWIHSIQRTAREDIPPTRTRPGACTRPPCTSDGNGTGPGPRGRPWYSGIRTSHGAHTRRHSAVQEPCPRMPRKLPRTLASRCNDTATRGVRFGTRRMKAWHAMYL